MKRNGEGMFYAESKVHSSGVDPALILDELRQLELVKDD